MKTVKAVAPYIYEGGINFKHKPYEAWVKLGGKTAPAHYPPRWLHGLAFRYEMPMLIKGLRSKVRSALSLCLAKKGQGEARLRFVEPVSLYFDTFPDYCLYEIIPFFWDVWPQYFDKVFAWLRKHHVRTAIFTSSQVAEMVRERFPEMNVLHCPEGIDVEAYDKGKSLESRMYDYLEYGRCSRAIDSSSFDERINILSNGNKEILTTREKLIEVLGDSKITICLPQKDTNPDVAGEIDTLTQRYWECMLARCVIIGRAPRELTDMLGYNPVIDLDLDKLDTPEERNKHTNAKILEILDSIDSYQELVDKNREMALRYGDWTDRIRSVQKQLTAFGYKI